MMSIDSRQAGLEDRATELEVTQKPPTWQLALPPAPDALGTWLGQRPKNLTRSIRKAQESELTVREGSSDRDLATFYSLYLETMRKHGSVPRSLRQLRLTRSVLAPVFRLFTVHHHGRMVAGGVFHAFRDTVELLYNASDRRYLHLRPNHALYRHVIEWSVAHGNKTFDFGFAWPGSSLAAFKAQWGAEQVPEYRYEYRPGGRRARAAGRGPDGGGEAGLGGAVDRAWARAPLTLTRVGGVLAHRYL